MRLQFLLNFLENHAPQAGIINFLIIELYLYINLNPLLDERHHI